MARPRKGIYFQALQVLRSCSNPPLPFSISATSRQMHTATRQTYIATRQTHTAVVSQRDLQDDLDSNPFYDKYKKKLEKIRGPAAPERKEARVAEEKTWISTMPPKHPVASFSYTKPPTLDSVMHLNMIYNKSTEQISQIWREYHKTKDCISAVIPAETYIQLHTKASHCPFFVYPVPRDEGYEFFYAQFSGHRCYFTSLINYQLYLENAPVCLTLTHYTDLQESRGIVLMAGEMDTQSLSALESQFLANQLQLYYATEDKERYSLVWQFNHSPENFDYNTVITQLQNSQIQLHKQS